MAFAALCGIFGAAQFSGGSRGPDQGVAAGPTIWKAFENSVHPLTIETPSPNLTDTDTRLVELAMAGDSRAFDLLVVKYERRIHRLIGRFVRDAELVEDIAQETFVRAWRALHQFRGDAQFYTWLYRIAVNTAKKSLMDLRRDPVVFESTLHKADEESETSSSQEEQSTQETPETEYAAREIARHVQKALDALPEDIRQAIVLREMEGLTYEEIAVAMNCPIGTVRSRIFRAREAISQQIRPLLESQGGKRW